MSSTKPAQKGGIKSKIICKYFIQGKCIKGENCPYLHSQFENPKETKQVECPMYSVGFCKNGPICHFLHIKKDKYIEEELEDKNITTIKPLIEEQNNKMNNNNLNNKNSNISNENNINNEKNDEEEKNNDKKEKNINFLLPIWYLEHYYDKPISMIFSELEQKNLPEIAELKKKYGFTNIEPNLPVMLPNFKKNKINLNMNTLNLNFNNFNMNLTSNNNHIDITNTKNSIIQNTIQMNKMNNDIKFDAYKLKKDSIEYLINKEEYIFYYLIRCKNCDEIKKSLETNTIRLPKEIYNKYKDIDIKNNNLTIIIIVFDDEFENFVGFAQLKYPLSQKNLEEKDNEKEIKNYMNYYKIEWLWRTKLHYSKVSHLMNREDNDQFLHEGKNGCPIDKDLGNYCCRLMIKRLSKGEVKELISEKKIFENQKNLLQNLKKEDNTNFYNNNNYDNKSYNNKYYNIYDRYDKFNDDDYSYKKYNNKYQEKSPFRYSNSSKKYSNDINSSKYNSYNRKDFKYTGNKKYRNNSKSRSSSRMSDSNDYSSFYKYKKTKKSEDNIGGNYYKYHSKNNYKDYNRYLHYNIDDNKSTDFSSKKSYH